MTAEPAGPRVLHAEDAAAAVARVLGPHFPPPDCPGVAQVVISGLAGAGWAVIPAAELEQLRETAALAADLVLDGREVIKPAPDSGLYVVWSAAVNGPVWAGSRRDALRLGIPQAALDRADRTGTSRPGGHDWAAERIAGPPGAGQVARSDLAALAAARAPAEIAAVIRLYEKSGQ